MSMYNMFRPSTFEEVFGQEEAVGILKAVLAQPKEERPKCFLLCGQSGAGKTTLTRIFARMIGCDTNSMDFECLDASKDRSIENIRNFTDKMGSYPMSKKAEARVFVLEESHQLLKPAQEALLRKTEDVPPATYIFFCTTEPEALGKPLRSRCKTIVINPMSLRSLYMNLKYVAQKAGIGISDEDAQKIAKASEESARVSIQILENYKLNGGNVDAAIAMGAGINDKLKADTYSLCKALISKTAGWDMAVSFLKTYTGKSEDVRKAILGYLRACILNSRSTADRQRFVDLTTVFLDPHYSDAEVAITYMLAVAWDLK
ncbi:MAG: AAA family ATPase [Bacteroidia bacterium]|nr:AAA family ATPase [Bacteroidia bacterium]